MTLLVDSAVGFLMLEINGRQVHTLLPPTSIHLLLISERKLPYLNCLFVDWARDDSIPIVRDILSIFSLTQGSRYVSAYSRLSAVCQPRAPGL